MFCFCSIKDSAYVEESVYICTLVEAYVEQETLHNSNIHFIQDFKAKIAKKILMIALVTYVKTAVHVWTE